MFELWCYIEGATDYFSIFISPDSNIEVLRKCLHDLQVKFINECGSSSSEGMLHHDRYVDINITIGLCWLMTPPGQCRT
jgi:hypothetical protein